MKGERHRVRPRRHAEHVDLVEADRDGDLVGGEQVEPRGKGDVTGNARRHLCLVVHDAQDLGREPLPDGDRTPDGRAHASLWPAAAGVGLRGDALLAGRERQRVALGEQAVVPTPTRQSLCDLAQDGHAKRLDLSDGDDVGLKDHPTHLSEARVVRTPRDVDCLGEPAGPHRLDRRCGRLEGGGQLAKQVTGVGESLTEDSGRVGLYFANERRLTGLDGAARLLEHDYRLALIARDRPLLLGRREARVVHRVPVLGAEQQQVDVRPLDHIDADRPRRHRLAGQVLEADRLVAEDLDHGADGVARSGRARPAEPS